MRVVFAQLNHFHHVIVQRWRFKLAVGFFTQVENGQACCQVLIIRRFTGDQVCRRFDDSFVDIRGLNAIVKLDMRSQFDLGDEKVLCPPEF
jgi:hypothetical protein